MGDMDEPTPLIVPVVLSGGSGTRLWPASREHRPKQLLPLVGHQSMLHETIDRVKDLSGLDRPIVVANAEHEAVIRRTLSEEGVTDALLILEPVGRNTAPAIAAAALIEQEAGRDPLLLVLPADHVIADPAGFVDAVDACISASSGGTLVTFGITPTHAETGFGYIRAGHPIDGDLCEILEFKEKPDAATASVYVDSGDYSWNSGMFLVRASALIEELEEQRPAMAEAVREAVSRGDREGRTVRLEAEAFSSCESESIDYAVMEGTSRGGVIPIDVGWSDVGSWAALWDMVAHDDAGNSVAGDVVTVDTSESLISGGSRLVAVAGLERVAVVDTADAVLVASLDSAQAVKSIVERLRADEREEIEHDGTIVDSWGTSTVRSKGPGHIVRELSIDRDATLRSPAAAATTHIQVLDGLGSLRVGDDELEAPEGSSLAIEPDRSWELANAGDRILRIVEILVDTVVNVHPDPESGTPRREP